MRNAGTEPPNALTQIPLKSLYPANNLPQSNPESKQLMFRLSSNSQSSYVQFNKNPPTVYFNTSADKSRRGSPTFTNSSNPPLRSPNATFISDNAMNNHSCLTNNRESAKRGGLVRAENFDYKNSKKRFQFSKSRARKRSQLKTEGSASPLPNSRSKQKTNLPYQISKQTQIKVIPLGCQHFEFGKRLGKGKFGEVYLVKEKRTGFLCAIKIILKSVIREEDFVDQFVKELKIQTYLNHPNILKMYGFFEDEEKIYVVLEYCSGGTLYDRICEGKRIAEQEAAGIIGQILTGLDELHYHKILHRDIKPENILIQQGIVKIGDFGWSTHFSSQQLRRTLCGTPLYLSPEILTGEEYDQKIDIWSLGIITYEMIVSRNPFRIKSENHLIRIIEQDIDLTEVDISSRAKDFIDKTLKKNPELRCEASQLLNHAFIKRD